jgi:hypothetical protein
MFPGMFPEVEVGAEASIVTGLDWISVARAEALIVDAAAEVASHMPFTNRPLLEAEVLMVMSVAKV